MRVFSILSLGSPETLMFLHLMFHYLGIAKSLNHNKYKTLKSEIKVIRLFQY